MRLENSPANTGIGINKVLWIEKTDHKHDYIKLINGCG